MAEPKFKFVMIHHSLSKDNEAKNWEEIRRYHTSWRFNGVSITEEYARKLIKKGVSGVLKPWADIGYHFGCEWRTLDDGTMGYENVSGRPLAIGGAHCLEGGMNMLAVGFCYVGNFDLNPPNKEQLMCGIKKIIEMENQFSLGDPAEYIKYHVEFASYKSCPGKFFPKKEEFVSLINEAKEAA